MEPGGKTMSKLVPVVIAGGFALKSEMLSELMAEE